MLEWRLGIRVFPRWNVVAVVILVVAMNIYGTLRLQALEATLEKAPKLKVGILQPHTDPRKKFNREHFELLLGKTLKMIREEQPDLILWPEGMDPYDYDPRPGKDPLVNHRFPNGSSIFDSVSVPLIVGGGSRVGEEPEKFWNTAAYILPTDQGDPKNRVSFYHKNILLIFGEKIPFEKYLPQTLLDSVGMTSMMAGKECPVFSLESDSAKQSGRFRILLCYESVLPSYARKVASDIDFLVNITEDMWYGQTSHTGQHVSVLMMRAVECRMPLVRCCNAGPSGVVEATGAFDDKTPTFETAEKVVILKPGGFLSFYKAGGYIFPIVCLVAGLILTLMYKSDFSRKFLRKDG